MIQAIVDYVASVNLGQLAFRPMIQSFADGTMRVSCDHIGYSALVDSATGPVCIAD